MFSDYFGGNRSQLIRLNSLNINRETWRQSPIKMNTMIFETLVIYLAKFELTSQLSFKLTSQFSFCTIIFVSSLNS